MFSKIQRAGVAFLMMIGLALVGSIFNQADAATNDARNSTTLSLDKVVTTRQRTNSTVLTSPSLTTAHINELLVAFVNSDGPSGRPQTISKVAGGGLTWQLRTRANTQRGTTEIWQAPAPRIVKGIKVAATRSIGGYHGSVTVAAFAGADLSGAGSVAAANGTGRAASADLITTRAGSWVWGVGDDSSRALAPTVGPGQSLVSDFVDAPAKHTFWTQRTRNVTATANTRVTINDTAPTKDTWNLALIEVLPQVMTDTVAPTVSITSPTIGATVSGSISITATAADNVAVTRVDFYRGVTLIGSSTTSPYSFTWDTQSTASGTYDLFAKAYDAAGNVGQSAAVSITVTPAVPPGVDNNDIVVAAWTAGSPGGAQVMKLSPATPAGTLRALAPSQINSSDNSVDVSPDGSRIVVDSNRENRNPDSIADSQAIFVMNTDGSGLRVVHVPPMEKPTDTGFQWTTDVLPRWSPDGTKIAFVEATGTWIGQNNNGHAGQGTSNIFTMNADGSNVTSVTTDDKGAGNVIWSPDSKRLAFGDAGAFYIAAADGSNRHLITSVASSHIGSISDWSPDGNRIYGGYTLSALESGIGFVESTDGFATTEPLSTLGLTSAGTHQGYTDGGPRLSRDGSQILFIRQSQRTPTSSTCTDGCSQLWKINTDGSALTQITAFSGATDAYLQSADFINTTWPTSTAKTVVALGDSVAAGEGINYGFRWNGSNWVQTGPNSPTWTDTTAAAGFNYPYCHQTDQAYSRLLYADNYKVFNMACTGATALSNNSLTGAGGILDREIFDGGAAPLAQLGGTCVGCATPNTTFDAHHADVVTLTIGANDIKFADWVLTCYNPNLFGIGTCDTQANTDLVNSQLGLEKADLRLVLAELDRRAAKANKQLRVLVTNYYDPFSMQHMNCIDYVNGTDTLVTLNEVNWLRNGLISLNANIASEVAYAKGVDRHLNVSLVDISTVMAGHEYCTADPWVHGPSIDFPFVNGSLLPNNNPSPFHPTSAGQHAIYDAVRAALTS